MDSKTDNNKSKAKTPRKIKKPDANFVNLRSNYFARFRFSLEELLATLKEASGKAYTEVPQVYECLDDLGHWGLVRGPQTFQYTEELETSLKKQFAFLQKSFDYLPGDVLLWSSSQHHDSHRMTVRVVEKVVQGDHDLFRVAVNESGATRLVSRFELDFWNASGSSLPEDSLREAINWDRDFFWMKRLNNFKIYMISKNFQFDFSKTGSAMVEQQQVLLMEIDNYFKLNEGPLQQRARGIGMLACGQGTADDSALVRAFALQALGQPFGLKARLWSSGKDASMGSLLLITAIDRTEESTQNWSAPIINDMSHRPLQRPLSEVLRKVLAKGPFGRAESETHAGPFIDNDTHEESSSASHKV